MSPLLNNVTIDGADDNQAYFSEELGRTREGYSTPQVAVQEFQVRALEPTAMRIATTPTARVRCNWPFAWSSRAKRVFLRKRGSSFGCRAFLFYKSVK
jgi:hypothetical protein